MRYYYAHWVPYIQNEITENSICGSVFSYCIRLKVIVYYVSGNEYAWAIIFASSENVYLNSFSWNSSIYYTYVMTQPGSLTWSVFETDISTLKSFVTTRLKIVSGGGEWECGVCLR